MGADISTNSASLEEGIVLSLGILIGVTLFFSILTMVIHYGRKYLKQRYIKYVSLITGVVLLGFCIWFTYDLFDGLI